MALDGVQRTDPDHQQASLTPVLGIKKASKIDQGTGSTFDALAARGLVQVGIRGPDGYPHLRITPAGRRLVRSWTGTRAYKAPPLGTLKEWHWRALAKAYAAGDEGLEAAMATTRTLDGRPGSARATTSEVR